MAHDKFFFMGKAVKIIKNYPAFNLVKIKYLNSDKQFVVDLSALTDRTDNIKTISIKLLQKKCLERYKKLRSDK